MKYRMTITCAGMHVATSPLMRNPQMAWHYALGWSRHHGEGINTYRELEGKAEDSVTDTHVEGDTFTYRIEEVSTKG